jgi:hypothetical protein
MAHPLVRRRLRASAEESVGDLAQMQQIAESAGGVVGADFPGWVCAPIGPGSRNERPAAVRQDHENEEHVASSNAVDRDQRPAFEGMAMPGDRHLVRDIMAMGSLSPVPSMRSTRNG